MKKDLKNIYFDVLDRLYLNGNVKHNSSKLKEQLQKDTELKKKIENVFENPNEFDVYYHKDSLELKIVDVADGHEKGMNDAFNRIDIQY
jgi:uncharacterized protein YacL (UPF0231 family)